MDDLRRLIREIVIGFVIIIIFLHLFATKANGQEVMTPYTYVEFYPQIAIEKGGGGETQVGDFFGSLSLIRQTGPGLGLFFESAHGRYWGETVLGPAFQVGSWNLSVAGGFEHFAPRKMRGRFNAYYDEEETGSFLYLEVGVGQSGHWGSVDAVRMFTKNIGAGILAQAPDAGVGPKVEVRVGNHLGFWVAPVYDWEAYKWRTLAGGRLMWER